MRLNEIVPRSHPAVAAHPEHFMSTSVGDGDWGDDSELVAELVERSQKIAELEEFQARRRRIAELNSPRPPSPPAWLKPRPTRLAKQKQECPWTVTLKPTVRSGFDVHLAGEVCRSISGWVSEAAPYGVETGGYLFGHQPLRSSGGVVCLASGPAPNSRHARASMWLGSEAGVRSEFPDWLHSKNFDRVGDWHTHPSGTRTPSRTDVNAWGSILMSRDRKGLFEYVSIIVTPGSGGLGPSFHGWVTHGERGRYVCQPAWLSDRLGYCSRSRC